MSSGEEPKVSLPIVPEPVPLRYLWWGWAAVSAVLCVFTGALSDIFWTVGVTVIIILVHGSLHIVQFIYVHIIGRRMRAA